MTPISVGVHWSGVVQCSQLELKYNLGPFFLWSCNTDYKKMFSSLHCIDGSVSFQSQPSTDEILILILVLEAQQNSSVT